MSERFVTFIGAKGGSGTSTIALDVALRLKEGKANGGVALIDADSSGKRSIAVLMGTVRTFDEARIDGKLPITDAEGLMAAELVDSLEASFRIRPELTDSILAELAPVATIVADAPQPFSAIARPVITRAGLFLVVLEPNLLGVTGARALINDMMRFGIPAARVGLVINERGGKTEVNRAELESVLGASAIAQLPRRHHRGYASGIETIARRIEAVSHEPALAALAPSMNAPIGDRRPVNGRIASSVNGVREERGAAKRQVIAPEKQRKWESLKRAAHAELATRLDVVSSPAIQSDKRKLEGLKSEISDIVRALVARSDEAISAEELPLLCQEVVDEAIGLGPLERLLPQEDISEIMVNGPDHIFVERNGKLELSEKRFNDAQQLRLVIERIIAPLGRRIDESSPMVDARLPDGSRVNAIIEPLALEGPILTIRRFGSKRLSIEDLVSLGALTNEIIQFLRAAVEARLNIVVSGGTGSGKTTLLNALSGFIPASERIVTIEDAAELLLLQTHVVRLESRAANIEGKGEVRIRDLVKNSLRMRPDRIIVGECRSGEALDMLQAMNTGHDGSLTTVHANAPRDAVARIETLVMMAGFDIPVRAIREQIAGAVDLIIQTNRMRDGSRKVTSISEVIGMEGDIVTLQEIVRYEQRGVDETGRVVGQFLYTGVQPNCFVKFKELGVVFSPDVLNAMASLVSTW